MSESVWKKLDPRGKSVALKTSTLKEHIIGDHNNADVRGRVDATAFAPLIAEAPRYIAKDLSPRRERQKSGKVFRCAAHRGDGEVFLRGACR